MKREFSDVLKKYAEGSEISINQQIKTLNIDRSTYFKFLKGERIPKYEMLVKIADLLGIYGNDFISLEGLYYEAKEGVQFLKEMHAVKECIETLFEKTSETKKINFDNIRQIEGDIENSSENESGTTVNGNASSNVNYYSGQSGKVHLINVISSEISKDYANVDMFISANDRGFFKIIKTLLMMNQEHIARVREIFQFPNDAVQNPVDIINSFASALELSSNGIKGYEAYYYYGTSGIDEKFSVFYPYCIILNDMVFFLNLDSYIEIEAKELADKIRERFELRLTQTKKLLLSYSMLNDFLLASANFLSRHESNILYAINETFCAAKMADEKLIRKYVAPEYWKAIIPYCSVAQQLTDVKEFIFLNGIKAFADDGKSYDFPIGDPIVLDREDRIYSLNTILDGLGTRFFIIDDRYFSNTNMWSFVVNRNNGLCFYKSLNTIFIQLDEVNVVNSFSDFFERIHDSHFVLCQEKAKQEIQKLLDYLG